ncbi:TPA: his operon leader peptide [Morganella morganii]
MTRIQFSHHHHHHHHPD